MGNNENLSETSLFATFSHLVGTNEAGLRLILTVFAGYPLALIHRKYVYGQSPNTQHIFFATTGALLGFWNYGLDFGHCILTILLTYTTLSLIGGTLISVVVIFIFNLIYLLAGYYYMGTNSYDINWTMPHCILVLRLIGIAYDCYDGQQPVESLSKDNKKFALQKTPSIYEICGHTLFPSGFLVGPQFPMQRYLSFINGEYSETNSPPDSISYAIQRLVLGLGYLAIFEGLGFIVSDEYMMSDEYAQQNIFKKALLLGIWGRFTLYKYIQCWLLTEGACILFGISHNGKDDDGKVLWNGVENVKLSIFENTTQFTHYIQSFNINTNQWVLHYIYKRLKFMGNRHVSQFAVLLFLAIWHGLHSGYYVCFFFEFIVVYMERDLKSIIDKNQQLSDFFANSTVKLLVHVLLRIYTFVFMGWCLLSFALLKFDRYWMAYGASCHIGSILFVLWPILYAPILRHIFKKNRIEEEKKND